MHVVGAVERPIEPEQLPLDLAHRVRVEELTELRLTEQRAELGVVEGERLRASLRERRIALVHEARDVVKEQRSGEG